MVPIGDTSQAASAFFGKPGLVNPVMSSEATSEVVPSSAGVESEWAIEIHPA